MSSEINAIYIFTSSNQVEHHQTSMDPRLIWDHQPDAPLPAVETPAAPSPGSRMFSGLVTRAHFYFKITVLNVKPEGGRWMVVQDVHTWVLSASNHLGQINFSYLIFLVDTKKGPTLCVFWVQGFKHEIKHTVDCIYTTDIGCFSQLSLTLRGPFRFPFMNKTFKTRDMTVNWWLLW